MIPKVIYQCWFGPNPIPEGHRKYMDSVRRHMPDYEIHLLGNGDLPDCRFVRECLKWKKYAQLSDYMGLLVLEQYGGIYLDADIEVNKSFDDLLSCNCFLGMETDDTLNPVSNAVIGAMPAHHFISEYLDDMIMAFSRRARFNSVRVMNRKLLMKGLSPKTGQQIGDIVILDNETMFSAYCKHHSSGNRHGKKSKLADMGYHSSRFFSLLESKVTGLPSYP